MKHVRVSSDQAVVTRPRVARVEVGPRLGRASFGSALRKRFLSRGKGTANDSCLNDHWCSSTALHLIPNMNITQGFSVGFHSSGPIEILTLVGELDARTATDLDAAILKCLRNGRNRIVANGARLDYISSAGLGVFLSHIDEIRRQGGDLIICHLRPRVFDVFDLLGFPLLFDIVESQQQAIEMLVTQPTAPN